MAAASVDAAAGSLAQEEAGGEAELKSSSLLEYRRAFLLAEGTPARVEWRAPRFLCDSAETARPPEHAAGRRGRVAPQVRAGTSERASWASSVSVSREHGREQRERERERGSEKEGGARTRARARLKSRPKSPH
eukprot:13853853-Alexandrium_andersonii.AAC.1